jgi:RNA polymerase primary sigma factor
MGTAQSREHERQLVMAAGDGDEDAREELVRTFMPSIAGVARHYRRSAAVDRSELLQEGVVGLFRALDRFDAARGTPFWAYATWWVRQAMQQLVAEMTMPVVMSDRALRQLARVRDARRAGFQADRSEPSAIELAAATGFNREHVERLMAAERSARSLEAPLGSADGWGGTFADHLADPVAEDAYDHVLDHTGSESLAELWDGLSPRERAVVHAHYGVGCPRQTLREIARGLSLSSERVRQIEKQALTKLRSAATAA